MNTVKKLRYTSDGALAECPCCGSLDVGGAHDTVHCYGCGLTIKKSRPLQNAIDAWNRRAPVELPAQAEPKAWVNAGKAWKEYPIGTKARQSWEGGYWIKTEHGWKWHNGSTFPTPGAANEVMLPAVPQDASMPASRDALPLYGRWHHGNSVLVSGSLRVARADFDTNPSPEIQAEIFDWMCATLNAALLSQRQDSNVIEQAAMYRWIRSNVSDDMQWYLLGHVVNSPEDFDKAIRAAIANGATNAQTGKNLIFSEGIQDQRLPALREIEGNGQ